MMAFNSDSELQDCLTQDDFSFVYDSGYTSHVTMDSRRSILEAVWLYLTYFLIHTELCQLREGMRCLKFYSIDGQQSIHHSDIAFFFREEADYG